jgi:hypothetical protein
VLPSDPVLSYRVSGSLYIVTQASIRSHLRKLVTILGYIIRPFPSMPSGVQVPP